MSNAAIKQLSVVRTGEQLLANALNIDFSAYGFGAALYDKRQADTVSKSHPAGVRREREHMCVCVCLDSGGK